jgi:hypothetical protein
MDTEACMGTWLMELRLCMWGGGIVDR